jgi:hypothetical protein
VFGKPESGSVFGLIAGSNGALQLNWNTNSNPQTTRKQGSWQTCKRPATVMREIPLRTNYLYSTSTPRFLHRQNYRSILVSRKGLAIRLCELAIRPLDRPIIRNANLRGAARNAEARLCRRLLLATAALSSIGLQETNIGALACLVLWLTLCRELVLTQSA